MLTPYTLMYILIVQQEKYRPRTTKEDEMKTIELNSREDEILEIAILNWEEAEQYGDNDVDLHNRLIGERNTILATLALLLRDMRQDPTWTPGCHQREVVALVRNMRSQFALIVG